MESREGIRLNGHGIGHYNGWSPEERRATLPVQREALRAGTLARPTVCSICRSTDHVWFHDERYDRPLEAYSVCGRCHRLLHCRFEEPEPWLALVASHGGSGAWFERLSLDPASQFRPFSQTYPGGLGPDEGRAGPPVSPANPIDRKEPGKRPIRGLSKSRITLFEQCPKRLWLTVYRPELGEETGPVTAAMKVGHDVGDIACRLHPEGRMIDAEGGLSAALSETSALLRSGWSRPLFEATFAHDDVLVRVDLMLPGNNGWQLAEVKSTTGVKPYHLSDVATQLWVLRGCGVPVESVAIRHIDTNFVLQRTGEFDGLFRDTSVDHLVEPLVADRAAIVANARQVLAGSEPSREMGAHCDSPFACQFKAHCGQQPPPWPEWPVDILPDAAGKKVARHWLDQGVEDLRMVPPGVMPGPKLARIHEATVSGIPWHDRAAIREEVAAWAYPHTFFDFETIAFAIPRWTGTRPYQQVPFQFSAHVRDEDGSERHEEFLSLDGSDPRRACALALTELPENGAVIAWNASFERSCLLGLAEAFPDLAPRLVGIADRLVDLLPVARRHYYHRDMRGSWSIKAVLPTLSETGYETLDHVKTGSDAQAAFAEAIDPACPTDRAEVIHDALLVYCRQDTEAMMIVLDALCR